MAKATKEKQPQYDILSKVELDKVRLEKVAAEKVQGSSSSVQELEGRHDWSYSIRKHEADKLVLVSSCKVYFVPEYFFNFDLQYSIVYQCKEELSQEEIKENVNQLLIPVGEINSLVVAQLSEKMMGTPFIIPPMIGINEK